MTKASEKAADQAINLAVALRRKIVDCRLPRWKESSLLDKATELLVMIERELPVKDELKPQIAEDVAAVLADGGPGGVSDED